MKNFITKAFKYSVFTLSLLVGVSLMSGCATHKTANVDNSSGQKWEDLFDSNEFKPVNENNQNLELKLKMAYKE